MQTIADITYSFEHAHPQELGFEIIILSGTGVAIKRWYRDKKHVLDALIP